MTERADRCPICEHYISVPDTGRPCGFCGYNGRQREVRGVLSGDDTLGEPTTAEPVYVGPDVAL